MEIMVKFICKYHKRKSLGVSCTNMQNSHSATQINEGKMLRTIIPILTLKTESLYYSISNYSFSCVSNEFIGLRLMKHRNLIRMLCTIKEIQKIPYRF